MSIAITALGLAWVHESGFLSYPRHCAIRDRRRQQVME